MRKIVLIDWYETLCSHKLWGRLQEENPALFDKIQTVLFKENKPLCQEWMRGYTRFCNIVHFCEQQGIPRAVLQTAFIRDLPYQKPDLPDFLPLIQKLRQKGFRVFIATDHFDVFGSYVYPYQHFEDYFDGYISSAEVGYLKGDSLSDGTYPFFATFLKQQKAKAADCLLIDNGCKTIDIVRSLGMQGILIHSAQEALKALKEIEQGQYF